MNSIRSIRLTGKISINEPGEYRFYEKCIGKMKFWINGKLISDYWHLFANSPRITYINFDKGIHDIKIEFQRNDPSDTFTLK